MVRRMTPRSRHTTNLPIYYAILEHSNKQTPTPKAQLREKTAARLAKTILIRRMHEENEDFTEDVHLYLLKQDTCGEWALMIDL